MATVVPVWDKMSPEAQKRPSQIGKMSGNARLLKDFNPK
jgi:hypothetical protein